MQHASLDTARVELTAHVSKTLAIGIEVAATALSAVAVDLVLIRSTQIVEQLQLRPFLPRQSNPSPNRKLPRKNKSKKKKKKKQEEKKEKKLSQQKPLQQETQLPRLETFRLGLSGSG